MMFLYLERVNQRTRRCSVRDPSEHGYSATDSSVGDAVDSLAESVQSRPRRINTAIGRQQCGGD